jgi:peroxiredoxin
MNLSNPKSHLLHIFLILTCSFLLFLTACGRKTCAPETPQAPTPPVNDLVLQNLASEFPGEIRTTDLAGQVQLVLFFRTDDEACRGMVSDWNDLQDQFQSRGFTLVGAVVDNRGPEVLSTELAALGLSWPVGLATDPVLKAFSTDAPVHAIPTAFLLSREGTIMRTYAGFEPISYLREDIDLLLNDQELPDRNPKTVAPEDNEA